jgi:hypothetical protein
MKLLFPMDLESRFNYARSIVLREKREHVYFDVRDFQTHGLSVPRRISSPEEEAVILILLRYEGAVIMATTHVLLPEVRNCCSRRPEFSG